MDLRELENLLHAGTHRVAGINVGGYPVSCIGPINGTIELRSVTYEGHPDLNPIVSARSTVVLATMYAANKPAQTPVTFHGMTITGVVAPGGVSSPLFLRCRGLSGRKAAETEDCMVHFCRMLELYSVE